VWVAGAPPPLAHVVTGAADPAWLSWITAIAMGVGVLGAVAVRRRAVRPAFVGLAALGLAGRIGLGSVLTAAPVAPYALTIVVAGDGGGVTSPMAVRLCGRTTGGGTAQVPGPGRLIDIAVDGSSRRTLSADHVALLLPDGGHRVKAELVTADHRAFQPRVVAQLSVDVQGTGVTPAVPGCS